MTTFMDELPTGDQWTDADFPPGDWDIEDGGLNPLDNHPDLYPVGGGANCYPGHSGGKCHDLCYIYTDMVRDVWICAIHQIQNCPNTQVIVFVGSRKGNSRQGLNARGIRNRCALLLRNLAHGEIPIGIKNSDHYATEWI